ncbi:MAG TPA: site-specific DNA-methyltransferase [Allosphingosinicella sp.]|jgi:site-specific DNA-methyltransferase (adenine-specific)|nr:site-specific DNA-methyltransferase [Allosphingosinicella sp.]
MSNKLYYGDNLEVLRNEVADESVDLVYLDPPFNSNASYSILFKSPEGQGADAQIEAFNDTWTWGPSASGALMDITQSGNHNLHVLMQALHKAIGENAMMAYLAMMAVRLVELHRVLRPTGSLYLHCDPTASHYLKLVLDAVFGAENFRSEISWRRQSAHNDAAQGRKQYGNVRDIIFFYTKSNGWTWHWQYTPYDEGYVRNFYRHVEEATGRRYRLGDITAPGGASPAKRNPHYEFLGVTRYWRYSQERMQQLYDEGRILQTGPGRVPQYKRYLDEMPGVALQNDWTDINPLHGAEQERLNYPTQKPRALLERIIAASSNEGDLVLDPFCGCGTAVDAAQKLGRHWIGIDITHLAIGLIEKRLREGYGDAVKFETIGVPKDLASAQRLATDDPHGFQHWITLQLGGWPWMGGKKGGDKGVDGYFYYVGEGGATETGVISVKAGGNVNPGMVRDLGRVMQRDGHKLGLFVCAALPTRGMEDEANSHGLVETEFGRFPALQCFTLAELFQDRSPKLPPLVSPNRRAPRVETRESHKKGAQGSLI